MTRTVRAAHGLERRCKGWGQEAALRMLMNNLDPAVAEDPANLIVYGGTGKAARNWAAFDAIVASLEALEDTQTLLIQSGKPVAVFNTHRDAPRVLLVNSMLVPHWANWEYFRQLEARDLIAYGQMTAGSWCYIGTQGIVQGTYETLAECARQHFGGSLRGRWVLTGGLGGMGGAQPLAVTMNDGIALCVEIDPVRIQRRIETGYLGSMVETLEEAMVLIDDAVRKQQPVSIGLVGNAAQVFSELVERGITPDIVTDQTSAHDPLYGYIPANMTIEAAADLRQADPNEYVRRSQASMGQQVEAMLTLQQRGAIAFDYGNNLRAQAQAAGVERAFDIPGFVPAFIRPLFCSGTGPFRWIALSGDPADIARTDAAILKLFPQNESLHRWITKAQEHVQFQGLPARICWLGYGERAKAGLLFNEMVARGELSGPIAIGRDHLDAGSVASPNRETEAMRDGSDAIADWPILNALLNAVNGATWVSVHHGGGVGIGFSIHAGMVIVADGTPEAAVRLERVLTGDPGMGVVRHVDAGYEAAVAVARERGVQIPMLP